MMQGVSRVVACVALSLAAGCGVSQSQFYTEERLKNGLVIILPGIEGESSLNRDVRWGLNAAGVHHGLAIYSWGRPIPIAGVLLNQVDFVGNRIAGAGVSSMITRYQQTHPGRPVFIVGHSGGGGVAVFAAEGMPEGSQVNGLILLSASISRGYDLTKALTRCKHGIVNFYNEQDAGLLGIGTTVIGNVDGIRGPSAGFIGFTVPDEKAPDARKAQYTKLFQIGVSGDMTYGDDPHASTTRPAFVSLYVAPWIMAPRWPAAATTAFLSGP